MLDWALAAALALAAPSEPAHAATSPSRTAAGTATVPDAADILALPPGLQAELHARVVAPGGSRDQKLQRLADYVFGDDGLALQYDNEVTRTVAQTWRDRRANCLSFTLLFVALARAAGLEAQVQEVGEVLAWYRDAGVIYNANHVNAGIRNGVQRQTVDLDSNILATRDRPRGVSDARAIAHFHNNRGAELMAAGDPAAARASLDASLASDAGFVPAWNNLGVLLLRQGDTRGAERAYLAALRLQPEHGPTLNNLVALYRRTGDLRQADRYAWRLEKAQRSDPFHQFMRALECENGGDYACAIARYRRAIRLQDGEHQFHFGLARAYFLSGDPDRAQRELQRAYALGSSDTVRSVYRRKLEHLRRWREQATTGAPAR